MKHFLGIMLFLVLIVLFLPEQYMVSITKTEMIEFHLVRVDSMQVIPYDDNKDTCAYYAHYQANTGETTGTLWYKGEDIPTIVSKPAYVFEKE